MLKTLGVLVGGIFVGAVAMEIIHKKWPDQLARFYSRADDLAAGMKEGFIEGYRSVTESEAVAEA